MSAKQSTSMLDLKGLPIVNARKEPTLRLAAGELARYLYLLTGVRNRQAAKPPRRGNAIVLSVDPRLEEQGCRLCVKQRGSRRSLAVSGGSPVGVLYGVYTLLERFGMGFTNGGDMFPERPAPVTLPADLDETTAPAFAARGNMLHYNFLCGPTDWGLADYCFYFDQLARQRMNVLLMHWYDSEPGAAYELNGEYLAGGRTPNSLSKPWGALASLRTSEFSFGTGRCFDEEIWSSPAGDDLPDRITEIKRTEAIFRAATAYAKVRGVRVAAGFEAPSGLVSPSDPLNRKRFAARLAQFLERNPNITYFALWQYESGGCVGSQPPPPDSADSKLLATRRAHFEHLGNERRIWEAIRFGEFARLAAEHLAKHAPHLRLVVVGWGGDRWMRFADYCLGYDKLLPKSAIFTCHDNIDASMGPNVSTPWGQLPPERERWAMPWVEGDVEDCWVRQPNVESLGKLAPDALAKGCQGLLNLQWRTRDVEEENAYIARFAWNPALTPAAFYRELATRAFGARQAKTMASIIGTLQGLGGHWSGMRGTGECGRMVWTGWEPHFPFELDSAAVASLIPMAEEASEVLSHVPPPNEDPQAGAFHLRQELKEKSGTDTSRLGVREMTSIAERLRGLRTETDDARLRAALWALHEEAYQLRYDLVTQGMAGAGYRVTDGFLIALHHVLRVAGYRKKSATLRRIRGQLAHLRPLFVKARELGRVERLDYLAATIDFVLHYDAIATRLAAGERFQQVVNRAGDMAPDKAAALIAELYTELVEAGMQEALLAYTRKLTTRCDWGVLTTLNVKPMPAYWQAIERLESFLPAVPPREIQARGRKDEVWISWNPSPKAAGYHLYRQRASKGEWRRVTREPLNTACCMFVDRPPAGSYLYAVTALDGAGLESPRSHPATAVCGPGARPRILACKPCSHLKSGEELQQRVVVLSDRDIQSVSLIYRPEGATKWCTAPMLRRFRDSYQGTIPAAGIGPGTLELFVRAVDGQRQAATWPASGESMPWSMTVT